MKLRKGTVHGVNKKYDKIVHVGHSYGSLLTNALVAQYPTSSEGIILTGYSADPSYMLQTYAAFNMQIAALNQPLRFGTLSTKDIFKFRSAVKYLSHYLKLGHSGISDTTALKEYGFDVGVDLIAGIDDSSVVSEHLQGGYLTWANQGANQFAFLNPEGINEGIPAYTESTKYPFTIGELLTGASVPLLASSFTGPVLIVTGSEYTPSPFHSFTYLFPSRGASP
jgi:pimeloyl-ACP methyl ester carboxylesterase